MKDYRTETIEYTVRVQVKNVNKDTTYTEVEQFARESLKYHLNMHLYHKGVLTIGGVGTCAVTRVRKGIKYNNA